ncbi:SH3 domain-containing protein [Devosia sp. XJ19-1]|uniref:SH3 domain-containing protein n=1 Tax=Devosia ureilytica TaxID=2952754 RepID=A0A9Q4FRH7_9HYPH|nr:SH3 domain-containing protein [Devosia ureilytica]MCP8883858.1 SH3 domain-containing protein [Devosia ureilytica]MCP8887466.1 SH3 domain-containing protein [Devosia ureilytica]
MTIKRITFGTTIAAITLLTTLAASAAPGVATGAVNVRTGPGTGYAKVGTLAAGEVVDVKQCQGSWCFVDRNSGTDGWASKNYLAPYEGGGGGGGSDDTEIPFNFGMSVGPGGPSFSFGIGDAPPPPPPPPAPAKVCFFKGNNFSGAQFCVSAGTDDPNLPGGWNDSISSIKVQGGAQVTVCKNVWYGGFCTTISTDKPALGSYNNAISSYQAF